ncbi:MAG: hypothetical protein CM15mP22_7330 [Gammaproteobacteria bacterium]|nr:MAG: hypothetical protein CM15mP22_7330 [Gammaproteobacteria bacterium]
MGFKTTSPDDKLYCQYGAVGEGPETTLGELKGLNSGPLWKFGDPP